VFVALGLSACSQVMWLNAFCHFILLLLSGQVARGVCEQINSRVVVASVCFATMNERRAVMSHRKTKYGIAIHAAFYNFASALNAKLHSIDIQTSFDTYLPFN
jgi:hypothetical protein